MSDVVYFVRAGDEGPVKIGVANDVEKRLKSISTYCPDEPIVVCTIPGDYELEQRLHRRLRRSRRRREWFNVSGDVATVMELAIAGDLAALEAVIEEGLLADAADDAARVELVPIIKAAMGVGIELVVARFGVSTTAQAAGLSQDQLLKARRGLTDLGVTKLFRIVALWPAAFDPLFAVCESPEAARKSLEGARDAIDELLRKLTVRAA